MMIPLKSLLACNSSNKKTDFAKVLKTNAKSAVKFFMWSKCG